MLLMKTVSSLVVKQFDGKRHDDDNPLKGNLRSATHRKHKGNFRNRNKITQEQYQLKTMKSPCPICGKYGHWKKENLADGSLSGSVKSVDRPKHNPDDSSNQTNGQSSSQKKTVSFNSATLLEFKPKEGEKEELLNPVYGVRNSTQAWQKIYDQHKQANTEQYVGCTCKINGEP